MTLGEKLQNPISLNYQDIPDFPHSTVQGHGGKLICGKPTENRCLKGAALATLDKVKVFDKAFSFDEV